MTHLSHLLPWRACAPCVLAASLLMLCASEARALDLIGVHAGNVLVTFDADAPNAVVTLGAVSGLTGGEQLVALDTHPNTGALFGVTDAARLYRIDLRTRAATVLGTPLVITAASGISLAFNPFTWQLTVATGAGDRLTIDSENGNVLTTGALAVTGIAALAYSYDFNGAATTLYGLSATDDTLIQVDAPPIVVGPVGVDVDVSASFDISVNGNVAYAVITAPAATTSTLVRITLATGAAEAVGSIAAPGPIAAFTVSTRSHHVVAVTSDNRLVSFFSGAPATLITNTTVTGLTGGESLVAIDQDSRTGIIYGVTDAGRLYSLNLMGPATLVAPAAGQPLTGSAFDLDFTPPLDLLRLVGDTGTHLTLAPSTGVATTHTALPNTVGVIGLASRYREGAGAPTPTTLYGIDTINDALVTIGVPNGDPSSANTGAIASVGPLGLPAAGDAGFEIVAEDGTAFAAIAGPGATSSTLTVLSLATGRATPVGTIGGNSIVRDLTVMYGLPLPSLQIATAAISVSEDAGTVTTTMQRTGSLIGPVWFEYAAFQGGTANDGADYLGFAQKRVTMPDGVASVTIDALIIDDGDDEPDETFNLILQSAQPAVHTGNGIHTATVTILDNDAPEGAAVPRVTITGPTTISGFPAQSSFVAVSGTAATASAGQTIASLTWSSHRGFSGTLADAQTWSIQDVPVLAGDNIVTVRLETSDGQVATDAINLQLDRLVYSLAEGATGGFFRTTLAIANPNQTATPYELALLREDGTRLVQQHVAPATSRQTLVLNDIGDLGDGAVSAIVTSETGAPLIVERTMQWDATGYGAHTEKAITDTAFTWYFAEGSQGFFDTYLLLANPHTVELNGNVVFLREGESHVVVNFALEPTSRTTLWAGAYPELVGRSFGMVVNFFSSGGSAERAMYFGRPPEPLWKAGHESAGVGQLSSTWYLAEGATGPFFETFVLLANPDPFTAAEATLTFLPNQGTPVSRTVTIPRNGRVTVNIEALDPPAPELSNAAVATQVVASHPIVVERAQYWPGPPDQWYEAHNSFGVSATHTKWGLAEGRVGNPGTETGRDYQTYILLANPGSQAATATVQFLRADGTTIGKTVPLAANSRVNLQIAGPGSDVPELADEYFGAVITADRAIAVERALYSSPAGQPFGAGTNATATRLP